MSAVRLLLVGLGARARTWMAVAAANPDIEIVAACDPDPTARARAAEALPGLTIGAEIDDIAGVEADAALLATPPGARQAQLDACCRANLAILAEKPLADDVGDAVRYVVQAEEAGVMLIVGLNFRYLAVTQAMRRLLQEGAIGTPGFGRFTYERWRDGTLARLNTYPLHMHHPMLWEQSIHHFDLMRYVYGAEPLHVQAHTWNPPWTMYAHDTNVSALIAFERGLTVNYQGTWQAGHEPMHFDWRTDGSEGIVVQREIFGDLAWGKRLQSNLTPVPLPRHDPWITDAAALLERFVRMVRGQIDPECTGRDHLQSLFMLEAAIRASDRRSCVTIDEVRTAAELSKEKP